jgi:hypothetical protein
MIPPEWRQKPDLILTTEDLLLAMHDQIVFIEKTSPVVKKKRLKALLNETVILHEELQDKIEPLMDIIKTDIEKNDDLIQQQKEQKIRYAKQQQELHTTLYPITAVKHKVLITPDFLAEKQSKNKKLNGIMTMLRTQSVRQIPVRILRKYRLLNDSILVTRKNRKLSFDSPGNLRIVCDTAMSLHILALMHVMSNHYGQKTLSLLFSNTYKCFEGNLAAFAKIICTGCRACRFHRPSCTKVIPVGRIPFPNEPWDTWMIDFMVFKREQKHKGKKIEAALNIVDLYSSMLFSYLTPDQTHQTVIKCLKDLFAKVPAPRKIVSDNARQLCSNKEVIHFLRKSGVQVITTTTAYNSKGNKVERLHKLMRETLMLVQETFRRPSQFDMYYTAIEMINSRPLSLPLHPHIKLMNEGKTEVVTPFSLQYAKKPPQHDLIIMEQQLPSEEREAYKAKWKRIMIDYDRHKEKELQQRIEAFTKDNEILKGDLVLIQNPIPNKERLKFFKELYEVVNIEKARYYCAPLFSGGNVIQTNANNLKKYNYSELFTILPEEIKNLMGENLPPDQLKEQATRDPSSRPPDFSDWKLWKPPSTMELRHRLTPPSDISKPAISLPTSSISSTKTESSGFSFKSGTDLTDLVSDITSIHETLVPGIPQIRSTPEGNRMATFFLNKLSRKLHKPAVPSKPPPQSIVDQAISDKDLANKVLKTAQKKQKSAHFSESASTVSGQSPRHSASRSASPASESQQPTQSVGFSPPSLSSASSSSSHSTAGQKNPWGSFSNDNSFQTNSPVMQSTPLPTPPPSTGNTPPHTPPRVQRPTKTPETGPEPQPESSQTQPTNTDFHTLPDGTVVPKITPTKKRPPPSTLPSVFLDDHIKPYDPTVTIQVKSKPTPNVIPILKTPTASASQPIPATRTFYPRAAKTPSRDYSSLNDPGKTPRKKPTKTKPEEQDVKNTPSAKEKDFKKKPPDKDQPPETPSHSQPTPVPRTSDRKRRPTQNPDFLY